VARDLLAEPRDLLADEAPTLLEHALSRPSGMEVLQRGSGLAAELANTVTSGVGAIGGGALGALSLPFPTGDTRPFPRTRRVAEFVEKGASFRPFTPVSPGAKDVEEQFSRGFEQINRGIDSAARFALEGADPESVEESRFAEHLPPSQRPQREPNPDFQPNPLAETAIESGLLGLTALLTRGRGVPKSTPRIAAAQRANDIGYVVPPGSVRPGGVRGVAQGVGGVKIKKDASIKNQANTDRLAVEELGLPEGTVLSRDVTASIRASTNPVFEAVRSIGEVATDVKFRRAMALATRPFRSVARAFENISAATKGKVLQFADDFKTSSFEANAAVDAIQALRNEANKAFNSGDMRAGRAYRAQSDALEGVIQRQLERSGSDPSLISNYRDARTLIAKTHSVDDALKGTHVSAPNLAAQANKGRPLSGNLKEIADFANEFKDFAALVTDPPPSMGVLDALVAVAGPSAALTTGALTQSPLLGAAALTPAMMMLARPGIRKGLLSQLGQGLNTPAAVPIRGPLASTELSRRRRGNSIGGLLSQ